MLLGRIEGRFLAVRVALLVGRWVLAIGHVGCRQIGNLRKRVVQFLFDRRLLGLQPRKIFFDFGNLRHKRGRALLILRLFGVTDLLGGGVAALLQTLKLRDHGAALLVERNDLLRLGRQPASCEAAVELLSVLPHPSWIEHGKDGPKSLPRQSIANSTTAGRRQTRRLRSFRKPPHRAPLHRPPASSPPSRRGRSKSRRARGSERQGRTG